MEGREGGGKLGGMGEITLEVMYGGKNTAFTSMPFFFSFDFREK